MLVFNFHQVEHTPTHPENLMVTISPDGLRNFIRVMRTLGFRFVCIKDILKAGGPEKFGAKDVLMTFDDGFENNLTLAKPVLDAEKCPATVFVLPGRFGGTNEWDYPDLPEPDRDKLMTLEQMKDLVSSGYITIGSHGMMHRKLPTLSEEDLQWELHESHAILSQELEEGYAPVFAYPWGEFTNREADAVKASPYQYAFTTHKDRWTGTANPVQVPRHSAYFRDGNPLVLAAKLFRHGLVLG